MVQDTSAFNEIQMPYIVDDTLYLTSNVTGEPLTAYINRVWPITNLSDTTSITGENQGDVAIVASGDTVAFRGSAYWNPFSGGGGSGVGSATYTVASSTSAQTGDYTCDGTADNVEIQAALDALGSEGGRVILLEGTFSLSDTIEIPNNKKIVLQGQGGGTILTQTLRDAPAIAKISSLTTGFGNNEEMTISDMRIENALQTKGIYIYGTHLSTVENIVFVGDTLTAIYLRRVNNSRIINNDFNRVQYGIFTAGGAALGDDIEDIKITGNDFSYCGRSAIHLESASSVWQRDVSKVIIANNNIEEADYEEALYPAIHIIRGNGNTITGNTISQTYRGNGIQLDNCVHQVITGNILRENGLDQVAGDSTSAIVLINSDSCLIAGNTISAENSDRGVVMFTGSDNNLLQANNNTLGATTSYVNYGTNNLFQSFRSGKLGFNTGNPQEFIHGVFAGNNRVRLDAVAGIPGLLTYRANGTVATPTAIASADIIARWSIAGYDTDYNAYPSAYIAAVATQTWTATANGNKLEFGVTPNNSIAVAAAMTIDQTGNVGVANTTPAEKLSVTGNAQVSGIGQFGTTDVISGANANTRVRIGRDGGSVGLSITGSASGAPFLQLSRSTGTIATPLVSGNTENLGNLFWFGYDGSGWQVTSSIESYVDGTVSAGNLPSRLAFYTGTAATRTERMRIGSSGVVNIMGNTGIGIGTTTPAFALDVTGQFGVRTSGSGYPTSLVAGLAGRFYTVHGTGDWGFVLARADVNTSGTNFTLYKTRNTDASVKAALVNGDIIARINFQGASSSTTVNQGATIQAVVNGTVSDGVLPTDLLFNTVASGDGFSAGERMRITSAGRVGIGTASPDRLLHPELSDAVTNAMVFPLRLTHITSGTAAAGSGAGVEFEAESAGGTNRVAGTIENPYTTATNAAEVSDLVFRAMNAGVLGEKLRVLGNGTLQIGTLSGTASKIGAFTSGNIATVVTPTITTGGTTGDRTINELAGTVNIAAAGTTVTVTNSLVTANSLVFCTLRTNDTTATVKNVVPTAGSFTINLGAAATGEVSIGFFVVN